MDRIDCTKDAPWDGTCDVKIRHVDAKAINGDSDYYQRYECPNCGHIFDVELAE